jgi:tetratricopeptide (TPR) repeat protein
VRRIVACLVLLSWVALLGGCSFYRNTFRSARDSFPVKYFYRPSYQSIGAMYAEDPGLAIELLERLSRKKPRNLSYKLTLAEMYRDRGRVNDAIRLWFDILAMSRERGIVDGRKVPVYFIPLAPGQKGEMRPYGSVIDKSLAYSNIARIYSQNDFFEEAAEYFSRAAESSKDSDRKAELYYQAGEAIGSKQPDFSLSEKGEAYQKTGDRTVPVDPMKFKKEEKAFYEMASSLPLKDPVLAAKIRKSMAAVDKELSPYQQDASDKETVEETPVVKEPVNQKKEDPRQTALELFTKGKVKEAVALWDGLATKFPEGHFLIEVELDCEVKSLRSTFDRLHRPDKFFVLSHPYKGKTCYMVCLGLFDTEQEVSKEMEGLKTALGNVAPRVRDAAFLQKERAKSGG